MKPLRKIPIYEDGSYVYFFFLFSLVTHNPSMPSPFESLMSLNEWAMVLYLLS